jgi:predicted transcriptional regulator
MMNELRSQRAVLGISQSRLARISGVSRFKLCLFELGDVSLTTDEQHQVRHVLQAEVERLRGAAAQVGYDLSAKPAEVE